MLIQTVVSPALPLPARTLSHVVQAATKLSHKSASRLIHDGFVRVNERVRTQSHWQLTIGDRVEIEYQPQPVAHPRHAASDSGRFEIVFEDDFLLVVSKPPNLLTVPTPHREPNTLLSQLTKYLSRQAPTAKAFCVHRLDRGVSGLLVFAKSLEIAELLRNQFAERKPARQYMAIVAGRIDRKRGTFRSYLATDGDLNRYSTPNPDEGELAITHYRILERWGAATAVQVHLETGRRNQIRVHFAEAGHPVLGDPRYRADRARHVDWPYKRLALHAESLGFTHPITKEPMEFRTSWPEEFRIFKRQSQKGIVADDPPN